MKNRIALFFASLVVSLVAIDAISQSADYNRQFAFVEDIALVPYTQAVDFYRGERVELTIQMLRDGLPINISSGTFSTVWGILDRSPDPDVVTMVKTAEVVSATSGIVKFTIMPSESVITSMVYEGYVTLTQLSGTNVTGRVTVQRQSINVRESTN